MHGVMLFRGRLKAWVAAKGWGDAHVPKKNVCCSNRWNFLCYPTCAGFPWPVDPPSLWNHEPKPVPLCGGSVVAVRWYALRRSGDHGVPLDCWIYFPFFFRQPKICGRLRCVVLSTFDCPAVLLRTSLRTVATVALFVVCPVGIKFQPVTHAGRKVHASFRFLLRMFLFFRTPRQGTTSGCSKNGGVRNFIVPEPFFFPIFAFRFFRLAKSQTLSHEHTASSGQQTPR